MNYQYPLETLARKAAAGSQLDFAREARRIFDDSDETLFEAHDHGLAIFAAHEEALERPVQMLQELYGQDVEVRRPKVRYLPGEPPHEPIMRARIAVPLEFADAVVRELKRRQHAPSKREELGRPRVSVSRFVTGLISRIRKDNAR